MMKYQKANCIGVLAMSALLATGCFWVTTKREGQQLRDRVDALDVRLQDREGDLEEKIKKLEQVLAEATKVLTRNSADLGADVDSLAQDLRKMKGLVSDANRQIGAIRSEVKAFEQRMNNDREVLAKRLESMEQRIATLEQKAAHPSVLPASELYAQAKAGFDKRAHTKARALFRQLVIRFPGHERADDSQYYRGESYFRDKDYDEAIREFQKVFDKYPTSTLADDALFRAGEAAQRLRRCSEARAYFGLLRQKYPKSSFVKKSVDKDRFLKRNRKNRKRCLS